MLEVEEAHEELERAVAADLEAGHGEADGLADESSSCEREVEVVLLDSAAQGDCGVGREQFPDRVRAAFSVSDSVLCRLSPPKRGSSNEILSADRGCPAEGVDARLRSPINALSSRARRVAHRHATRCGQQPG